MSWSNISSKAAKQVDLDKLVSEFVKWQKDTADIAHAKGCLKLQIRYLTKQIQTSQTAENVALEEAGNLKSMVEKLQGIISQRCNLEEENAHLKEQISTVKGTATSLEQEMMNQISEAMKNLEASDEAYKKQIVRIREDSAHQTKREVDLLEKALQEKTIEIRQLQKQFADLEHEKHAEIVKLRLEFDAKLLKLQESNAKAQASQTWNVNKDIFRKKLQFAKAEAEKDIISLRNKVSELERKLAQHQQYQTKRKRF